MAKSPKEFFRSQVQLARESYDTHRFASNPYAFLKGRQVVYSLLAPALNKKPLYDSSGNAMLGDGGVPMGQLYPSPIPSQSSSPLYDLFQAGPVPQSYEFPSGIPFSVKLMNKGHQLTLEVAAEETGVRVLPWGPDACTFMRLDSAAKVWLTGPLSGCNIYACGDGPLPVVLHANSNQNASNTGINNGVKRSTAIGVANTFGGSKPLWGHLERGASFYGGLGFVFGVKRGSQWNNYYASGSGEVVELR